MTDRERIPTVLKEQIALCGKDGERERIIVYLTSDDAQRIVDWLEEQDTVEYALDTLRRHGWKEDGYGDLLEAEKTEFVYDEYSTPACKECGFHPFAGYIPTIKWMRERGYKVCPGCGREVAWDEIN